MVLHETHAAIGWPSDGHCIIGPRQMQCITRRTVGLPSPDTKKSHALSAFGTVGSLSLFNEGHQCVCVCVSFRTWTPMVLGTIFFQDRKKRTFGANIKMPVQ